MLNQMIPPCALHCDFRLSDAILPLLRPAPELLNLLHFVALVSKMFGCYWMLLHNDDFDHTLFRDLHEPFDDVQEATTKVEFHLGFDW